MSSGVERCRAVSRGVERCRGVSRGVELVELAWGVEVSRLVSRFGVEVSRPGLRVEVDFRSCISADPLRGGGPGCVVRLPVVPCRLREPFIGSLHHLSAARLEVDLGLSPYQLH